LGCRSVAGSVKSVRAVFRRLREEGGRRVARLWLAAAAVGLAISLLPAAPAFADCQPDPAATGQTVTCSGTDNNGFAAGAGVNQLTVNVLTGATVNNIAVNVTAIQLNDTNVVTNAGAINATGDDSTGISAGSGNTITNAATGVITVGNAVTVGAFGIVVVDNNIVTNLGTIQLGSSCGCAPLIGISANNNNTITNVGPISGGDGLTGISAGNNNNITNLGPITGGNFGAGISVGDNNLNVINRGAITFGTASVGISGATNNVITNDVGGIITVGDSIGFGGAGIAVQVNNTVTNLGTIRVGSTVGGFGLPAAGILGDSNNNITNVGSIAGGSAAAGIFVLDNNTIANRGSIVVGDDGAGIFAQDNNTITNAAGATITAGNASFLGAAGIVVGFNNVVTNLGTIVVGDSCGCIEAIGIKADSGNTIVNGGTIRGGNGAAFLPNSVIGIDVFDGNAITNNGSIIVGNFAIGIRTGNDNNPSFITNGGITNNGTIIVGNFSTGVELGTNNLFTNNGLVRAGAQGFSVLSCGCSQDNLVTNNGTLDGMINLDGSGGHVLTNNGLITITDPGTPVGAGHFIAGDFIQSAAGTLALRVNSAGVSDLLTVTNATLGGTLRAIVQPGLYGPTTYYAGVVSASNPIGTQFTQATSSSVFFTATAIYDPNTVNPNSVDLLLSRIPFGSVPGETQNQRNVGSYLEQNYSTALTGNAAAFFGNLLTSPSRAVLDNLSGEGTVGTQHAALNTGNLFTKTMLDQVLSFLGGGGTPGTGDFNPDSTLLQYAAVEKVKRPEYKAFAAIRPQSGVFEPRRLRAWMSAFGGTQSLNGDPVIGSADASNRTFGAAGGFDYQVTPDLMVGFAGAGSTSTFSVPGRATNGTLEGGHVGLYGVYRWGAAYLAGTLSYSHFSNDTYRTITGVGPTETARGQFGSDQFGGRLQTGYKFAFDRFAVTPFAAVQYLQLWQRGYSEASFTTAGAPGILGLTFQSRAISSLPTFLGAQVDARFAFAHGVTFAPFVRASWVHEFMPDRNVAAALGILPTGTFIVDGPRAAADAARIEAGGNLYVTRNVAFFGNFIGEYSGSTSSSAGNGGLRVTW
jgi:uncharacterized protein with beta-barrel porin domain